MWKRDDNQAPAPAQEQHRTPTSAPRPEAPVRTQPVTTAAAAERATIGRSITIRGDVTGDEDLLIQGHIEGKVDLKQHSVTIGPEGKVKANVVGRSVTVEGEVEGDLSAQEIVLLRSTARVQGNITAPRVALDEGAVFRGGVDMSDKSQQRTQQARNAGASQAPAPAPANGSAKESDNAAGAQQAAQA